MLNSMEQLSQFGTIFYAYGCKLNYESESATLAIIEAPKGKQKLVDSVLAEISLFDMTANHIDGMASLCLASTVDSVTNPLPEKTRLNILTALGIMEGGRFIHQVLQLQKNNRSWHFSDEASVCSHFGDECVTRGITPNPEHKGRRSNRKPEDYHVRNGKGLINREQLVTKNLEQLVRGIPESNLISAKAQVSIGPVDLRSFKKLPLDKQMEVISMLQGSL